MPAPIELLYADPTLLVLNKPPGLLSVPGKGEDKQDCLSRRVQATFDDALVVHRLDMATSGLLLMARNAEAQKLLNQAFAERAIHKRYIAIVAGDCRPCGANSGQEPDTSEPSGWQTIDLPILVDWPNRPLRTINHSDGKPSQTRWRCVAYDASSRCSRLELEPLTGRSHQLRVHLQAIGHPIVGDALYAPAEVAHASNRLLLHASALSLVHPDHAQPMHFSCPDSFGSEWP